MSRDSKGKNRKQKHNREKNEEGSITPEQLAKVEKYAKGEDIEEEEEGEREDQQKFEEFVSEKYGKRQMKQQRNYELPEDSD